MKKIIFIIVFFCCTIAISFAQQDQILVDHSVIEGTILTKRTKKNLENVKYKEIVPKHALSINLIGFGVPFISNDLSKSEIWNKKAGMGWQFGIGYRGQFSKKEIVNNEWIKLPSCVGFDVGIGLSYLKQSAFMKNHTEVLSNFKDVDGDFGDVTLSYKDIKESTSILYMAIPISLEIFKPSLVKITGYMNVGLRASILLSGKCSGEGTYTAIGDYQNINCIFDDVDYLNYSSNDKPINEKLENNLSPFVLWGSLSGGVNIPFSNLSKYSGWILRLGAKIDYSILKVSKSIDEPYFKGANYRINQSNVLSAAGSRIFMPGVEVKLIYSINSF